MFLCVPFLASTLTHLPIHTHHTCYIQNSVYSSLLCACFPVLSQPICTLLQYIPLLISNCLFFNVLRLSYLYFPLYCYSMHSMEAMFGIIFACFLFGCGGSSGGGGGINSDHSISRNSGDGSDCSSNSSASTAVITTTSTKTKRNFNPVSWFTTSTVLQDPLTKNIIKRGHIQFWSLLLY